MKSIKPFKEPEAVHRLKNHLGVVLCFAQLVGDSLEPNDPRRDDITAIHLAARDALDLLPELTKAKTA